MSRKFCISLESNDVHYVLHILCFSYVLFFTYCLPFAASFFPSHLLAISAWSLPTVSTLHVFISVSSSVSVTTFSTSYLTPHLFLFLLLSLTLYISCLNSLPNPGSTLIIQGQVGHRLTLAKPWYITRLPQAAISPATSLIKQTRLVWTILSDFRHCQTCIFRHAYLSCNLIHMLQKEPLLMIMVLTSEETHLGLCW